MKPIAWTIAGSDSGGGAGIQADLKAMTSLGAHACTVVTAITAQNPKEVSGIELVSEEMVSRQLTALEKDLPAAAIKTGMLGSEGIAGVVARYLQHFSGMVVCDPVMIATSGAALTAVGAPALLFERADLVTPNLAEAEALKKANRLQCRRLLIKGGHRVSDFAADHFISEEDSFWLTSPRLPLAWTHGTGCTLSATIAAGVALGHDLLSAIVLGKAHLNRVLGHTDPMPWISDAEPTAIPMPFPALSGREIGVYPIVDRASWLEKFVPLGVKTLQLRIKDLKGEALDREIARAVRLSRVWDVQLFINDYWDLALKHGAYGVHLGQEDMDIADIEAIRKSGMRLGISTHSLYELARAKAWCPSYLALGPIYRTTIKQMRFAPQGMDRLSLWRGLVNTPLVAIGGIRLENVPALKAAGADGVAVITDILQSSDPVGRCRAYVDTFS